MKLHRDKDGTLPAFAWPGGYPIYYLTADGGEMCPDCANGKNGSEASESKDEVPEWRLTCCDIHYEGAPIQCCHCGAEIESAYGDPDTDDCGPVIDLDALDPGPLDGFPHGWNGHSGHTEESDPANLGGI